MQIKPTLLAFDLGTSGNKAVLVDPSTGGLIAATSAAYPTSFTSDGGAQQDPSDWWASVASCCAELKARAPRQFDSVAAIGCSGIMNGAVLIDSAGNTIRKAIIHADMRGARHCERVESELGIETIYRHTQNRLTPLVTMPKLMWLAQAESEILTRARWVVQAKDYIAGRLTQTYGYTDPSDASLTGFYDLRRGCWSEELWRASNLPRDLRPVVRKSTEILGTVSRDAAAHTGLKQGIPVAIGGGDGACASAGSGAATGQAYISLGGTSWLGTIRDEPLDDIRVSSYCCLDERVTSYGTVQSAGSAIEWAAGLLAGGAMDLDKLERLAQEAQAGDLYFLPYLQGERAPLWDSHVRGVFLGLSSHHGRGELYRAAIEGVACALRSIMDVFAQHGALEGDLRLIGGGTRSALWCDALSALSARRLGLVAEQASATSTGASMAAGVGVGLYESIADAARLVRIERWDQSEPDQIERYEEYYRRWSRIYPLVKGLF